MLECLIIGDSIAVGTANVRQECVSYSKGGWNSWQWNKHYIVKEKKDLTAQNVIISLGTNDHKGVKTFDELMFMRRNVTAGRVYWILPPCNDKFCKPSVNEIVEIIAKNFGDTIISTKRLQADAIHPSWAGYKELAEQSKK
jgi:lysophospholipase L1-like esterase